MQNTKTKRVFQLRKTGLVRPQPADDVKALDHQDNNSNVVEYEKQEKQQYKMGNDSFNEQIQYRNEQHLTSSVQVILQQNQLHFCSKVRNVQIKDVKVKNVGTSAVYYDWVFKHLPKINPNSIKDPKPVFYCHYQPNVIKPGEQQIFSFCFYSQIPGIYVEEVDLICQPHLANQIAPIKLKGEAFIQDSLKVKRQKLTNKMKQKITEAFTKQIVQDIVGKVKEPTPPLPDVSNPEVAQKQFQAANSHENLFYHTQIHKWFNSLFEDVCNSLQIQHQKKYWNQSLSQLRNLINDVKDPILQQSYEKRLTNYKFLSTSKPPQKSDLFPKVKQLLLKTGYSLGGSITDQTRKQLQMWQILFQEPSETQTQEHKNAKKDEKTKVMAEWVKKMKKKKWTEQEQKQLVKNYKEKLQKRVGHDLLDKLNGFDKQASYEECRAKIKRSFNPQSYFTFLQRLKTVKQFSIQGKKILLKFDLKLKQNCQQSLLKLQQYLEKKKEQQLRIQEEKKNQQTNKAKKKVPIAKKKKGQKQEQETKVLSFDFNTILDQQSWEGFIQTLKLIVERQPLLLLISICYGPKNGVKCQKYSVKFLLQLFKQIEPSVQFLEHQELFELKEKVQNQTLNEGSIYLCENFSFLPCEGMQSGFIKQVEKEENGTLKKVQTITSHKLLMSQIDNQLQTVMPAIDIIVRQDRLVNRENGICSYGKKESILGLTWWKYIALTLRTKGSHIILGGKFQPSKLVLITKIAKYSQNIYLVGELGLKVWMCVQQVTEFGGTTITKDQQLFIKQSIQHLTHQKLYQKINLPKDFVISQLHENMQTKTQIVALEKVQLKPNAKIIDVGKSVCEHIQKIQNGHLFIIEHPSINQNQFISLQNICKTLLSKKEAKKLRHQHEQSSPAGISYDKDLVIYLVGISEESVQKIQLTQKKVKSKGEEEEGEEQQQDEQQKEQNEQKKIDMVCDFRVADTQSFQSLLAGQFSYGLKDVSRYPKSN